MSAGLLAVLAQVSSGDGKTDGRWVLAVNDRLEPLLWEPVPGSVPVSSLSDVPIRHHIAVGPDGAIHLMLLEEDGLRILRRSLPEADEPEPTATAEPVPLAGGRIVFAHDPDPTPDFNPDVFSVRPDGSDLRQITNTPYDESAVAASPDGSKIAFMRTQPDGHTYRLWVMDTDGGNPRMLSERDAEQRPPAWSPDGTRLAFAEGPPPHDCFPPDECPPGDESADIMMVDVDGTDLGAVTECLPETCVADSFPDWSPDGRSIVFEREVIGEGLRLFVVPAEGGPASRVDPDDGRGYVLPRWDGSSRRLLLTNDTNPYLLDLDTGRVEEIVPDDGRVARPGVGEYDWSPDGSWIVVTSTDYSGGEGVFVMRADGSGTSRVLGFPRVGTCAASRGCSIPRVRRGRTSR